MARFGGARPGIRIFVLFLLLIALTLGGMVWFDYLGLFDAKDVLAPVYRLLGMQPRSTEARPDDPNLLDRERLTKQGEEIALREEELNQREAALDSRERELVLVADNLKERETAAEAREKAFNEQGKAFENRRVNLVQNSRYLVGMPPKNAVDILLKMEDQDIIDQLRVTEDEAKRTGEESIVAYWLSLMPSDRAADLQRKMSRNTGG